ncbi:MAG: hypothetical protein CL526_04830 [Aequorivita sp.]|nr:hypothetical protein [Aequorivita sp.]|tara:strand:+ start:45003 stop:45542 length:540 start_codon:yes stop_codon:yes gene_type:complete
MKIKNVILQLFVPAFIFGIATNCEQPSETSSYSPNHWENHYAPSKLISSIQDSVITGKSYLSIYSHIYSFSKDKSQHLTAMASLRNTSETDTVYIFKADYYSTEGTLIREYFKKPIFLRPLETVTIVIDETDKHGGSGANFIFEWKTKTTTPEPYFEAIMTSLRGSQGLSFTTIGKRIK